MSNVKVNSSSDFSLAFDLSAALRLSLALLSTACTIPKGRCRGCLVLHTLGNNSQWLLWQNKPGPRVDSPKYFLWRNCSTYVFTHEMVPPCAIFFFHLWCSCQEENPKSVTTKAAQSLLYSFSFWHITFSRCLRQELFQQQEVTGSHSLGTKMPLNTSIVKIITRKQIREMLWATRSRLVWEHCGTFWNVVEHSEMVWKVLERCGTWCRIPEVQEVILAPETVQ